MSNAPREQASARSSQKLAAVNMRASACSTDEPLVQSSDPSPIAKDALGEPSLRTDAACFDNHSAHTLKLCKNVDMMEEIGKQSTIRTSKPSVINTGSEMIDGMQNLQHKDPSFLLVNESTAPAQTLTETQLPSMHESIKETASVLQPSKDIVKYSTDEDDQNFENLDHVKVLPCVGAFTVQCALCMKWRLIPTKEQYEEIRQSVLERPFFCTSAAGWRPNVSCEDPSDVSQDEKHLWALDKPNIPIAPPGWERQIVIRAAGASKFADVYYVTPLGRKLRSMPEVERFLAEFPEYIRAGVRHSQFSFIIPRPLDTNYCRKRTANNSFSNEGRRKSKSKQAQVKRLSAKRKALENSSHNDDSDEGEHSKSLKAEKPSEMANSHDCSIREQVIKASIPPEELMKELFGSISVNPEQ